MCYKTLSKKSDEWLVVSRQELYDFSYDKIRKELVRPEAYIDPDLYINIFAKYYGCDIIVFKVDKDTPNGEISLPRSSIAHLSYKIDHAKDVVVIVKFQKKRSDQYQCELLAKYDKISGDVEYIFQPDDKFIDEIFRLLVDINKVYICSPGGNSIKYEPSVIR